MKTQMTRGVFAHATVIVASLALLSTAGSAQDSFGGKPGTAPQPQPTRAPNGPPSGGMPNGGMPGNAAPRNAPNAAGDMNSRMEKEDYGVAPTRQLHNGPMHGPTPSSIPGGQVITTAGLLDLQRRQIPHVIIDVLGGPNMLPNAMPGAWMSQPGSFNDQVQQRTIAVLMDATQGRKDVPLVFYCQGTNCWMSYNAALRAINGGFTNVLWYRGGVEAWMRNTQQQPQQQYNQQRYNQI